MSTPIVDTVETAAATTDQEMPYAGLGLAPDEYSKIVTILGRRPTDSELYMYSIMWSEHCSYKSSKVHLRQFAEKAPKSDRLLAGHRRERRRDPGHRQAGGHVQGRVAQPPELRRAVPGRGDRRRRHRPGHPRDGRPPDRGDGSAALRRDRPPGHEARADRHRRRRRRVRQLPRPAEHRRRARLRRLLPERTRCSTRCASAYCRWTACRARTPRVRATSSC